MIKVILDTDPGVGIPGTDADDPIALLLALADPRLEVLGVTTIFGNCPPGLGARGALAVLSAAGRADVPVHVGAAVPLSGRLPGAWSSCTTANVDGKGDPLPQLPDASRASAAEFIVEQVNAHPGEVTVIAVGPQTNLALAMRLDPGLAKNLRSVVFMGGALGLDPTYGRGNVTPVAECNIWYDPEAADVVFRSGVDLTMVSLDVTNPTKGVVLSDDAVRELSTARGPVEAMLARICETYLAAPMFTWAHGCVLYDPLAVVAAADPGIGTYESMAVGVELNGTLTTGQTVPLRDAQHNLQAMVDVDGRPVVAGIVRQILALDSTAGANQHD